jgi:membrane protein
MRLAASLAFYTMLSIAPLLVITMKIVTTVAGEEAAHRQVLAYTNQMVGPTGGQAIADMIAREGQSGAGVIATIISTIILIFSASGVFVELQATLNRIWEVKPDPGRGQRASLVLRLQAHRPSADVRWQPQAAPSLRLDSSRRDKLACACYLRSPASAAVTRHARPSA